MLDEKEDGGSDEAIDPMHHRQITLPDGRYMIFYTFGETEEQPVEDADV